ncbi:MAG: D-alanyl-D-alanine carboxypeptidase/D-alanyl-D-alanine-endopeptidase [Allosphingosinicella sp.]|uniref:D-alanyl-D-alanine carboxypeptidase/D-alanyl-D-alanine endopeptidase n=1 Tax=Allosphingosinicella sp. TaxID=2823234 RepID=UPI0039524AFA
MTRAPRRHAALFAALQFAASPAFAQTLQERVEARLAEVGPGPRFGLVVADADGRELVAIQPDTRFVPASNTKMLVTAAAFAAIVDVHAPDAEGGAAVRLEENGAGAPDVVLVGNGDARLSGAADCVSNCLAALADAVASRTRTVNHVVGDDSLLPDERWSLGMSWNNIQSRYGTAISALTLDDNEFALRVLPGAPGDPPRLDFLPYYEIDNRARTVAGGETRLVADRMPGSLRVRLTGTIRADAAPQTLQLGIDDPAHHAAWRLRNLLAERGVRVGGEVMVRHRPLGPADDPARRGAAPPPRPPRPEPLARLTPPPLAEDLARINKASQNVHSELMLRRVGLLRGSGSTADGIVAVAAMMEDAGVPRASWDISDGSGMSTYNRLAPRGVVRLLRWIEGQPWGEQWRATLPVAGVDGTLARRFRGTPLEGRLFAKTGTLNATFALSGYMTARSGRILAFSAFANDVPEGGAATAALDEALILIAEAN